MVFVFLKHDSNESVLLSGKSGDASQSSDSNVNLLLSFRQDKSTSETSSKIIENSTNSSRACWNSNNGELKDFIQLSNGDNNSDGSIDYRYV